MELTEVYEKALLHELSQMVGLDAAQVYWQLISSCEIPDKYSHNKYYRILQHLYDKGFLFKAKFGNSFKYLPIPLGSIFVEGKFNKQFIEEMDEAYQSRLISFKEDMELVLETNGKNLDGLILFFIKNFMKQKCNIIFGGEILYNLIKNNIKDTEKIKYVGIKEYFEKTYVDQNLKLKRKEIISGKRMIIIDDNIVLNYFKVNENSYFGYVSWDKVLIEDRKKEFDFIWNF